jgi:hypothetical protein
LPRDANLREESLAADRIVRQRFGKKLEGHGLTQLQVVGAVDLAHATASHEPDNTVAIRKNRAGSESSDRNRA